MIMRTYSVFTAAVIAAGMAGAAVAAPPLTHYQPAMDITKDKTCSEIPHTAAERVAHNRKLAELYFLNLQHDRENGRNYGWYGELVNHATPGPDRCVAAGATALAGAFDPLSEPQPMPQAPASEKRDPTMLSGEQRAYFATYKDWKSLPGTLAVLPYENAVYFRFGYDGHDPKGNRNTQWEVDLLLVNDQGKITHIDMSTLR